MAEQGRICIVTPGQLGSNPRVVKEAEALVAAGYDVTVVCTKVADFVEPRDQAVMADAQFTVRRVEFDRRWFWRLSRLRQIVARLLVRTGLAPGAAAGANSPMVLGLTQAAVNVRAEIYIAHYPPALPAVARAAARHGRRYAFDAEDYHLGDLPDLPEHAFEKRLIRLIEGRYLPGAAYVTAASPMIAQAYAKAYGIAMPTTIQNVFPRKGAPLEATPRGHAKPGPSLYWFSQTIGAGRGLEDALDAIALAKSAPHLYLRGTPAAGYLKTLQEYAARIGVEHRLHVLPPVAPGDLERSGGDYDIGYVGELAETPNRQIALTNKLFSYLTSGLPVLASDIPAHRQLAPELGEAVALFPVGDAAAMARALDGWLLDPEKLASARRAAWCLGQGPFSWETEQGKLVSLVASCLAA